MSAPGVMCFKVAIETNQNMDNIAENQYAGVGLVGRKNKTNSSTVQEYQFKASLYNCSRINV